MDCPSNFYDDHLHPGTTTYDGAYEETVSYHPRQLASAPYLWSSRGSMPPSGDFPPCFGAPPHPQPLHLLGLDAERMQSTGTITGYPLIPHITSGHLYDDLQLRRGLNHLSVGGGGPSLVKDAKECYPRPLPSLAS